MCWFKSLNAVTAVTICMGICASQVAQAFDPSLITASHNITAEALADYEKQPKDPLKEPISMLLPETAMLMQVEGPATPLDRKLYGTLRFFDNTPITFDGVSNPESLETISETLTERPVPTLDILSVEKNEFNLPPVADRAYKASLLLLSFGGGLGNGVFKNIRSTGEARDLITQNFRDPIGRAVQGWKEDKDSFRTNFIEHPVLWFSYATYLKSLGASDKETWIITQAANWAWENVLEGSYVTPSGKDLLIDFLSCWAAIYMYKKGPGQKYGKKILAFQDWGARHGMKLVPAFGSNRQYNGKGFRFGTQIVWLIR